MTCMLLTRKKIEMLFENYSWTLFTKKRGIRKIIPFAKYMHTQHVSHDSLLARSYRRKSNMGAKSPSRLASLPCVLWALCRVPLFVVSSMVVDMATYPSCVLFSICHTVPCYLDGQIF
jgi:hypothetical protein